MTKAKRRGSWAIILSLIVALMLTALPLPDWTAVGRPAWVALALVYWCMAVPGRVGVMVAWIFGLLLDAMSGALLGQHAFGLALLAFITHKTHRWVRVLPLWQQVLGVFGLVLSYQFVVLWINGIRGFPVMVSSYWATPLVSMLLWPWVFIVLRDLRRKCGIA